MRIAEMVRHARLRELLHARYLPDIGYHLPEILQRCPYHDGFALHLGLHHGRVLAEEIAFLLRLIADRVEMGLVRAGDYPFACPGPFHDLGHPILEIQVQQHYIHLGMRYCPSLGKESCSSAMHGCLSSLTPISLPMSNSMMTDDISARYGWRYLE